MVVPKHDITIPVTRGASADRPVLLGFAAARTLHEVSFADVLDEAAGTGYQRRFSPHHSLDFRRYIQRPGSTTIPLTFNLRAGEPRGIPGWRLSEGRHGAKLVIQRGAGRVLSQVDCQHRLGRISDLELPLPFMCFIGLSEREELEIFSVINSKAKGIRGSLLDYHAAQMAEDLGLENPELLIALHLNAAEDSPWYRRLDLGGDPTLGLKRKASLRLMQQAVRRFLSESGALESGTSPEEVARIVLDFWCAVAGVLPVEWANERKHYLTKGVGVYALMGLLADFWREWPAEPSRLNRAWFEAALYDFAPAFNWSTTGPLKGLGGGSGAQEALQRIRAARRGQEVVSSVPALPAAALRRRRSIRANTTHHG